MLYEFICLISLYVNMRAGLVEAESRRAFAGVNRPTIQHYDKKPPASDGRIPLYLRRLRSTQFNRTALVWHLTKGKQPTSPVHSSPRREERVILSCGVSAWLVGVCARMVAAYRCGCTAAAEGSPEADYSSGA